MKRNRNTRILTAASALCVSAWCATNALALGPSLNEIPTYPGDTSNEGRAVTFDGQYVVGLSTGDGGGRGFLYWVGSDGVTNVISADNAQSTVAAGVGYRTALDPVYGTNRTELIIAGNTTSGAAEFMTPDGGLTFGNKRRNANWTYGQTISVANQLGSDGASDAYYIISRSSAQTSLIINGKGTGQWVATVAYDQKGIATGDRSAMNGISASGLAVGWRGSSTSQANKRNYKHQWNGNTTGAAAFFNGLDGTDSGEAHSVSADGTVVFGRSRTATDTASYYGYKVVNPGAAQTINALPEFSDTAGSVSRAVPYGCTADGQYAVGMNYRGQERAVIWDASNPDPNVWTVLDLTDLARNNGFLGDFTLNLRRAYSAGTNGAGDLVVTGFGVNSAATTRAYLMTVPKWIAAIGFPGNQTVNLGANVSIALKTNGTDSLTYQWYKDGNEMPGQTTTALSLNNVSCAGGQAGVYSVVVSNAPISSVVTGAMTLTVLDPYFLAQPSNQTNVDGTIATFTVMGDGAPTLSYKWQRGGVDLTDGDTGWGSTIYGATTPTLTISNVQPFDAMSGDYTAIVTTSAGGCSATSRAVTLKVLVRPVLSTYVDSTGGNYTLSFDGPFGLTYEVRFSTDITLPLTSWTVLTTDTFYGPAVYTDIAPPDQQRFYIVNVVYP